MARIKPAQRQQILEQTRQRLLEAAAQEFASAGYPGANINTISTAAGYAKGTIYNYFASKQALLLALIEATAQHHLEFITGRVRPEPTPLRRLEMLYLAGFEYVTLFLARSRVLFNTIHGSDEDLKAQVFAAYQPLFRFVAEEILVPGVEQGVFQPVEPQATALLLMTIYLGTASQIDPQGHPHLDATQVAGLVTHGLVR